MKIADRSVGPPIHSIEKIELPKAEQLHLKNGIPVWSISGGTAEVIRLEIFFEAGRWQEPQRAGAATTGKMLLEGTKTKSAQQIAEAFEFYGANVNADAMIDYAQISLFVLNKHLPSVLPLLREVIYEASFPEKELDTSIQNSKQRLLVNLQKVDFLAQKEFNERLYGASHPNGYTTTVEDYDLINAEMLRQFHATNYKQGNCTMIIAGKVTDEVLKLMDEMLGAETRSHANGERKSFQKDTNGKRKFFTEKSDAVQSAIRIGNPVINKRHPDFASLRVLNTVLGGYFGSRLMQNLREDKGYCYGVHSGIASFLSTAHLVISTEVGKEVTDAAVNEIYKEVVRLREELIPEEELQLVKNYLLGVMLADIDGPFNAADIYRGLIVYDLDEKYFRETVRKTKEVTAGELFELANKYFDPQAMIEVVAGPKLSVE